MKTAGVIGKRIAAVLQHREPVVGKPRAWVVTEILGRHP